MDDLSEQQEVSQEISEAISNPIHFSGEVDEVSFELLFHSARNFFRVNMFSVGFSG